jgi:hypothetical protein
VELRELALLHSFLAHRSLTRFTTFHAHLTCSSYSIRAARLGGSCISHILMPYLCTIAIICPLRFVTNIHRSLLALRTLSCIFCRIPLGWVRNSCEIKRTLFGNIRCAVHGSGERTAIVSKSTDTPGCHQIVTVDEKIFLHVAELCLPRESPPSAPLQKTHDCAQTSGRKRYHLPC